MGWKSIKEHYGIKHIVQALRDEPKGAGWNPSAANDWLRRPLKGVSA